MATEQQQARTQYLLHLADDQLILGQRLGEWCGHGPVLEQDIALTNIALDLIGQARLIYQSAAEQIPGATEDTLAFVRLEHEYRNVLLVEQPNGNFGDTVVRQYLFDVFNFMSYSALLHCTDDALRAIAEKAVKEVAYHKRWSGEWVVRLGDGTDESHEKVQHAVNQLWPYTGELFEMTDYEIACHELLDTPDVSTFRQHWLEEVGNTLRAATLEVPHADVWMHSGGKQGRHSEHMGYLLTEMQYMQRAYPEMQW